MPNVVTAQNSSIVYLSVNGSWYCYDSAGYSLGNGALGIVYLGFRCDNQDKVAVKKIRDEYSGNRQIRESARNEALIRFSHPNIVKMIGYCQYAEDYGPIYILSEYISGITFDDHVRIRLSILPLEERIRRILSDIRPVLSALQYLHQLGVVHRDIKPSNIMIDSESHIKLVDLGISTSVRGSAERVYEFVGTPQYAAPEQIPDSGINRMISPGTDIYAIGVMLYELITGINPFAGNTRDETFYNHIRKELDNEANLPAELFAIIKKATEKNPDLRYASAMELDADIVRFLSGGKRTNLVKIVIAALCITAALLIVMALIVNL